MARSRRWGWHQLDSEWAERLVTDAPLTPGCIVLDIGAGTGTITGPLLAAGVRVIAVESHPQRARQLRERFGNDIVVVQTDAGDLRLPRRPFHVVANPPFAITSPLLRRLLHPGSRLLSARMVVQEQAAIRWSAPGAPAAPRWRRTFEISVGPRVPRRAFRPPPRVDPRILRIDRH